MPYASNADLPDAVRGAYSERCQTVFRRAFNGADSNGQKESTAFAFGHTAAKRCEDATKSYAGAEVKTLDELGEIIVVDVLAPDPELKVAGEIGGTKISDLPDSSFACPESRTYPIRGKDGKLDASHVRNALARLANDDTTSCGASEIRKAAKELGIGQPAGKALIATGPDMVDARAQTKADRSFDSITSAIQRALNVGRPSNEQVWPWQVYDSYFIYQDGGRYFRRDYTLDAKGEASLGEPVEVVQAWDTKTADELGIWSPPKMEAGTGEREIKGFGGAQFELKDPSPTGFKTLEGYVSTFGTDRPGAPAVKVDLQGDCVDPGAFIKTIRERVDTGKVKLLTDHVWSVPTTMGTMRQAGEDSKGLGFKGDLIQRVQWVQDAAEAMAQGHITGLSMGYETVRKWFEDRSKDLGKRVRHLAEVKLFESSATPFPADEDAMVLGLKSNRAAELAASQLESLVATLAITGKAATPEDVAIIRNVIDKLEAFVESGGKTVIAPKDLAPDVLAAQRRSKMARLRLADAEARRYGVRILTDA